jgi:hypothetical protein
MIFSFHTVVPVCYHIQFSILDISIAYVHMCFHKSIHHYVID